MLSCIQTSLLAFSPHCEKKMRVHANRSFSPSWWRRSFVRSLTRKLAAVAVVVAARAIAGRTAAASAGPTLAALAVTRRPLIAVPKSQTPAPMKRRRRPSKRLRPANRKRTPRSENNPPVGLALGAPRASVRSRPADQSRRHASDHRPNNLRSGLDEDRSAIRSICRAHQDQAYS